MRKILIIKSFFYRVICILSTLLIISLIYTLYTYLTYEKKHNKFKSEIAEQISSEVFDFFKENETLLHYFGRVIIQGNKYENLYSISELLTTTGELSLKSLTTSYISWADSNGVITVNGKSGVNKNPNKNIISRDYFSTCKASPWTLQVSPITRSIFSSKIILPTAMGISHEGQFKGYLVLGLWVEDLIKNLKSKTSLQRYDFLLVDERSKEIIGGSHYQRAEKLIHAQKSIIIGNTNYNIYNKVKDFPFKVYVGIDKEIYLNQIIWEVAPKAIEFLAVLLVLFFIVLFLRNNVVKPLNELSYSAKEISEKDINHEITHYKVDEINTVADSIHSMQKYLIKLKKANESLRNNYKVSEISFLEKEKHYENALSRTKHILEDIDVCLRVIEKAGVSQKETNNLLDHCKKLLKGAYTHSPSNINHTVFDINNLLNECISYFNKEFIESDLKVLKSFTRSMPMYKGDRFQLKQVIIASMSKSINRIFEKGFISVESNYENEEFTIVISDDGILERKYNKILNKMSSDSSLLACIDSPIEVLAELLNGEESNITIYIKDKCTIIHIRDADKKYIGSKNNLINIRDYQER